MIFCVHSLYILVYDSCWRCLCARPMAAADLEIKERHRRSATVAFSVCDDIRAEMDQESIDEPLVDSRKEEGFQQGNSSDSAFYHEETGVKFSTPVYIQRYCSVIDVFSDPRWKGSIKKARITPILKLSNVIICILIVLFGQKT
jgi:hypothetical protein